MGIVVSSSTSLIGGAVSVDRESAEIVMIQTRLIVSGLSVQHGGLCDGGGLSPHSVNVAAAVRKPVSIRRRVVVVVVDPDVGIKNAAAAVGVSRGRRHEGLRRRER